MTEQQQRPEDAIEKVGELATAAAEIAAAPGSVVVPSGVGQAEAVKADMVQRRAALERQKQEVQRAAAEAKALIQAQVKEMERKLAEQLALLEPAMKELDKLSDGVDALNIYLGRDEQIIPIADGERAPAGTVITVRQLVLAMDEESVLFADRGGMDFRDIDQFIEWLQKDPAHLDQLLPEPKGVVAVIPRRARKDYGDPWMQSSAEAANKHTWWLIRNGEAVWLTTTEFVVGNHTVPSAKEFTDLFMVPARFGAPAHPMEPGSKEWMEAEEHADKRTRHYMKVALLLQGLLDRTTVFHPHDGASFLDQSHYDAGRVKVILDGENAVTDGRPSFADWRRERVALMHAGMRVIGAFSTHMQTFDTNDRLSDVRPKGHSPASLVPYNVRPTSRPYYDWEFSFARTDEIWDEDLREWRTPKTKATAYLRNSSRWWLPLDTITEDEIRYYMNARTKRHEYLDMIPALRAALEVKVAERQAEAPFRAALIDALAREAGLDASEELADELITWYKTANQHHRALDPDDAKAARVILTEARRRARGESKDADRVKDLLANHSDAMVVARRSNDFVVAVPETRMNPHLDDTVFCTLHVYTVGGKLKETRTWVTLTRAQVARWTVHHRTDAWDAWTFNPDPQQHYTDAELMSIVQDFRERYDDLFIVRVAPNSESDRAHGCVYRWNPEDGVQTMGFTVARRGDRVAVVPDWRGLHKTSQDGYDEPHWDTRWSGEAGPQFDVYRNHQIEAQARAIWQAKVDAALARRKARDRAISVATKLEAVWEAAAEEQVKARFLEDYGDLTLWDGHRKTIKLPHYPHRWKGDTVFREKLTELYTADPDLDVTGMTVAQILDLAGAAHDEVDESLLNLVPVVAPADS